MDSCRSNKKTASGKDVKKRDLPRKEQVPFSNENFTYMLRCADGSLYTGWTNDLTKRVAAHNAGTGSKYTRSHRPVELVYYEVFPTKEEAMHREAEIKLLSKKEKEALLR